MPEIKKKIGTCPDVLDLQVMLNLLQPTKCNTISKNSVMGSNFILRKSTSWNTFSFYIVYFRQEKSEIAVILKLFKVMYQTLGKTEIISSFFMYNKIFLAPPSQKTNSVDSYLLRNVNVLRVLGFRLQINELVRFTS